MKQELPENLHRAFARAAALCAAREYCSFDLGRKLKSWGLAEEETALVLARLEADGFVDEERYARAFVQDKTRFNGWGRRKIDSLLAARQISPQAREAAFASLPEDSFQARLVKLLRDKANRLAKLEPGLRRRRLTAFGLSRGYSLNEIASVLDELAIRDE